MGHQLSPLQPPLGRQRDSAFDIVTTLATGGVDGDIAADHVAQVQGHWLRVEGHHEYFAAALGHLRTLLWGLHGARALDGQVATETTGQFLNSRNWVLLTGINDMVGAETVSHFETARACPYQDDAGSPELLAGLDGHETHRARAKDGNIVPRNIATGSVETIQTRAGGGKQHRILERYLRRHFVERADVVQH